MPEGLQSITQADFSAGAFPGLEDVPVNGVEDIVDGFLRDDAAIERRGGTSYVTTSDAGVELVGIWDGYLVGGQRTVAWTTVAGFYVVNAAGTGVHTIGVAVT